MGQAIQYAKMTIDGITALRDLIKLVKESRKKLEHKPAITNRNRIYFLEDRINLLQRHVELNDKIINFLDNKVLSNLEYVIKIHEEKIRGIEWLSKTNERMVTRLWKKNFPEIWGRVKKGHTILPNAPK